MLKKEKRPLLIFAITVFTFYLFFTHLIIKTDDGHFIGILNNENFTLIQWLKERYLTVSGRTVNEFLMMSFLKINPIFWKITAGAALVYIVHFLQKICGFFGERTVQNNVFCCCVPFLVFIGALNPAVFWFAGSFTFLFPFVAFLMTVAPLTFDFFEIKHNRAASIIAAFIASFLACSQEQTAALTVTFLLILIVSNLYKHKLKIYHIAPLFSSAASAVWLFTSPGMTGRISMESGNFGRFNEMNLFEKLLCGFSNYFSYSFYMSLIVLFLFCMLLYLAVRRFYESKSAQVFPKVFLAVAGVVCIGVNAVYFVLKRMIPDKGFQQVFQKGEYDVADVIALCAGFILLGCIFAMLFMIIKKDRKSGFTVALLFAASVCSGVVMGFSSSIYASGQRVFFFTDILVLFASAVLFVSLKDKKSTVIYNISKIIALVMFALNCFNFALLEIPIMG